MSRPPKPTLTAYRRHLLVCTGTYCSADGMTAEALDSVGRKLIKAGVLAKGPDCVKASRVNCLGACRSGPVFCVQPDGVWYYGVTPADVDRIIDSHLLRGEVVEDLVFHRGPGPATD